jgi:exopolyphosphatase/guanosine-5'-triphosphate,3'-diphosphate pyrophosphatase
VVAAGDMSRHGLPALSGQRAPVYPGGLAILIEVFDALALETMEVADGALREGLLRDLVGRLIDEDARDRSVRAFQQRFHVDTAQAERVEGTALAVLEQLAGAWDLPGQESADLLSWAARLHEVGLDIAHSHHHHHAAYLVRHADLAGFSVDEQEMLAVLVGGHRRKIDLESLSDCAPPWRARMPRLLAVLRLAVLLNRSRAPAALPVPKAGGTRHKLKLQFPAGWLEERPLTRADLSQEARYLAALGIRLSIR